ncbi:MAG TPA: aromatic ring-hydroxylating dioxygenase subunit alpha [Alphaproteobacteria bacterium]|nr:aromatic ring-hydroxylating dioxygenase subunit alpha [Alphaproteobacteria bacterium]
MFDISDETKPQLALAAALYRDEQVFEKELNRIHRRAWHLLCHRSEIAEPGRSYGLDLLGRRVFAVRGEDGQVRVFHNVCRHRAHAVVPQGPHDCGRAIICPYHAWSYALDGRIKAVAVPGALPGIDPCALGLNPVEHAEALGFIFFRLEGSGPGIHEQLGGATVELGCYRIEQMVPQSKSYARTVEADWKAVWDNYLESYHFGIGHPGLSALMRPLYREEADQATRTIHLGHDLRDEPEGWSNRLYVRHLPDLPHLPEALRRRWHYLFVYPAFSLELYPESMDFFHVLPLAPGRSLIRCQNYALPGRGRAMRLALYLGNRINRCVQREDEALITSVQKGLVSQTYDHGLLTLRERSVARFQNWVAQDLG